MELIESSSAAQFLELLDAHSIDVAILDCDTPQFETCAELAGFARRNAAVPWVLLTSEPPVIRRQGPTRVVSKPFVLADVCRTVLETIGPRP